MQYPKTPTVDQADTYHGTVVPDPYRWLEDDNAEATKAWVAEQNKVTFAYLEKIPRRAAIKDRITKLWNFERWSVPGKRGGRYFLTRNDGLQNQSVLYTLDSLSAEPKLLLDPNKLSADGTVALSGTATTEDGNLMAYGLSTAGSDWQEWKVRDVRTGKDTSDHLKWVKFSGASWLKDGSGFFYSRYDEPDPSAALTKVNYFQKLYLHKLGTPQSADALIYHRTDQKDWGFHGSVTDDGRYLVITVTQGTDPKNRVLYKDLATPDAPAVELRMAFDASYDFVDNNGPVFYFKTDLDAPRSRLIAIDVTKPDKANWKELIPQSAETLGGVNAVAGRFVAEYLKDAHTVVRTFGLDGKPMADIPLPGLGSAGGFGGRKEDTETFYSYGDFTVPGVIYRHDFATGKNEVFRQPRVDFDPSLYETKQVFVPSKDGTKVPVFLTHKKGLKLDGTNPTLLYGYGGFNIPLTPGFAVSRLVWMEMGGVYAMANLRGGGEYGEEWHQAGTKLKKQNVFDDFISAAEWLVKEKYTSPQKLAIQGGSNGGLLVGACMTQRPDLFRAALPAVGVMDMIRFQKFTIGWAWQSDYGSADDAEQFKALYAYSPYHNLKPGTRYPSTLVTTADHDDRVVPAHSFKFAARLQACQAGENPTLIRVDVKAGHGGGKPTAKVIEEQADVLAFLVKELGVEAK
ncbi:MAG: prolyl oligopeptidase [Phycisphaerales bacterium]|nr:prolyl oligopeptidase [Phycisphaerales bacterium]